MTHRGAGTTASSSSNTGRTASPLWGAAMGHPRGGERPREPSQSGIGRLAVVESPNDEPVAGRSIALGPINSIGRNVNSTVYVEDDFVSGSHAMLTFRGRSWFIEDLGSTNGTYVNGHRGERPGALSFGDELMIGRVRMRLAGGWRAARGPCRLPRRSARSVS